MERLRFLILGTEVVPPPCPVARWGSLTTSAACLQAREADSWGSSVVWYVEQVIAWNVCTEWLRWVVVVSKNKSVSSIWIRSFVKLCQVAKSKRRSRMTSLWGEGKSPSKTGIAHYGRIELLRTKDTAAYLKKVFKIPCCQPLHRRGILVEPSDCSSPECSNHSIPIKLVI